MPGVYWNNGMGMGMVSVAPSMGSMTMVPTVHMAGPATLMFPTAPPMSSHGGSSPTTATVAHISDNSPLPPIKGPGMSQYPKVDPPPPYGMNPPMQPGAPPVAVIVGGPPLGPQPSNITCPSCHAQIQTRVTHQSSTKTHVIALLLCLFGCWPCVCLPYCMDSCQNATHHCPRCGSFLGTFQN